MVACATAQGRTMETCTRGVACRCVQNMRNLLQRIAYPRRGSQDESMDIYAAAKLIQERFTADQLSDSPEAHGDKQP